MPDIALSAEVDDQKLLAQVIGYYHHALKESPTALDYLRERGVTVGEAIDRFRIGYADRTLGLKLPVKQLKTGKEIRGRLQHVGLFRKSGHEHFNGCVVFPMSAADGSGRIVDMYGRKTNEYRLRKGTPLDMYLGDDRRGVWNVEAFAATDEIVLCPSLFDALTFWNAGYRNVSCTFGPDALTDDHLTAFGEFGIRRVLVAAETIAERILEAGVDCYLLKLPPNLSVNQYALQVDDPARALEAVIRKAEWLGKGKPASPLPPQPALDMVEPDSVAPVVETDADATQGDILDELTDNDSETNPVNDSETNPEMDDDDQPVYTPDATSVSTGQVRTASPVPTAPLEIEADVHHDEVAMEMGHRRYRVRGLSRNLSFHQMKVNVLASTERGMFVDTFDLYSARHRRAFTVQAAVELGVEEKTIKKDLGRVLLKLEELQDEHITRMLEPKDPTPTMTADEKDAALRLLRDPRLLDRIVTDFNVVGETMNKLVGYLAAVSRKLNQPLAIIVQSSSSAGKSALMDAILSFVPPEDQVKYSAMTGQSLFYMGETDLKHKILAIAEEEGAERATYALKLLQSEGELMIASTGKEPSSGRLVTHEYRVEGPVIIFLTTTAIAVDEELLNRCIVLTVDEDRDQTRAIHQLQRHRQTLAGLLAEQGHRETLALHRNVQRMLKPLLVANPFAESLTFIDDKTRTRRDHLKYLTLIRTVALLHQYQRPVKTTIHHDRQVEYIEVTLDDIGIANRLACEALGRSVDELPPQTRRLLTLIDVMVTEACERLGVDRPDHRFTRRDIRESTGWGHTQLKIHLKRLEELEYLLIHRGGRGQSIVYELL